MTHNSRPLLSGLFAASLLCLLTPTAAVAQPADPFEAIVSNPDGAKVRLNDTAIPLRNPTEDELRQYMEAFRVVNIDAAFTVDDRSGARNTRIPGDSTLGPLSVPNGTEVSLKAGFVKRPGEEEAVLRTLELKPTNPMANVGLFGLRFHKMHLDSKGVMHLKLNVRAMGIDFWPSEIVIEKIYRDSKNNLVFETGGKGLFNFAPNFRITPDGQVQRQTMILRRWKDLKDSKGEKIKVPSSVPITDWPPKATDILEWLPKEGDIGDRMASDIDSIRPVIESIPVSDLSVKFHAEADPKTIELANNEGTINLTNHTLDYEANGSFEGRTYVSNPNEPNRYSATATITGDVKKDGLGSATIDRLDVKLDGEHSGRIPFTDPSKIAVEGTLHADIDGEFSDLEAGLPGGPRVSADRAVVTFDGDGKAILRPLTGNPDDRRELSISKDSRYTFRTEGDVTLEGLDTMAEGVDLPETVTLTSTDGTTPVVSGEGDLGAKLGLVVARTKVKIDGKTRSAMGISALDSLGKPVLESTLKPGARVEVDGYAFAGIKADTFTGGGVRLTADAHLTGTGTDTTVNVDGAELDAPGETDLDVRVAANVRRGTVNGDETIVRELAADATATVRSGDATFSGGLPGTPTVSGTLKPGSSVNVNTGRLLRNRDTGFLETEGLSRGERGLKAKAHLILDAGSVAHRDMAMAFNGRTVIDLEAAVGLRLDPANPSAAPQLRDADLAVKVNFASGSTISVKKGAAIDSTITLAGNTEFAVETQIKVDAQGRPLLSALENVDITINAESVDLKTILQPLGTAVVSIGRSSVRIKKATVVFLERGLRITHGGVMVELAPGVIEIGTR